jgi:hypothetical protein
VLNSPKKTHERSMVTTAPAATAPTHGDGPLAPTSVCAALPVPVFPQRHLRQLYYIVSFDEFEFKKV